MATHFDLPPLQPFDPYTDPSSVGQRWKSWRRRFQTYIAALNVTDKTQQRALLLYQVGQATQEIFDTIPNNGADDDYKTALDKLDAYFLPKKNIDYEIFQFRQAIQQTGETVDQYATRLRKLAAHCEFEKVDNEIKSTIIQNCSSKSLRRYALREEKLTLELLLNKARALEVSESQATGMEQTLNHSEKTVEQANFVKGNRNSGPKKPFHVRRSPGKCKHCGYTWPHTKSPCPAKGKQCNACGKDNHFSSVCRSKGTTQRSKGRVNRVTDTASTQETQATPATNEKESSSDDEYLFTLGNEASNPATPKTSVKINEQNVQMIIDTGASTDIIDKATFDRISVSRKIKLQKSTAQIFAYGSDMPLKTYGKFETTIESKKAITIATIHVIEGNSGCLLSYNTACELSLIALNLNTVTDKPLTSEQLQQRYPEIFNGLGQLQDFEVKLHIDESVPPVAQAARRIPFHMRKKVSDALDELEKQNIIERVEGPTPYVSPIVVIPKKDGSVRICVDMRIPNKAIQRERHPSPTVDDLIHSLNGAKMFSKLDLRSGYHQLTLAPECRYITTFATHKGLRRYRRLNFGTSSAGEIFQHVIHEQIRDIPGALNISDDVIIYGTTVEEHNKALHAVCEKFAQVGLTLNREKCLFNQTSLTFFGFVFSDKGISPDPAKVQAIHDASSPKSASAVRSFLGMATYCAKFIPNFSDLTFPLRELTKKNAPFTWTSKHEQAFVQVKKALTSHSVMSYFDQTKETEVITDASPYGLSGILTQTDPNTRERKVVAYVSRTLTPVERRYSQTEREALGIVWAIERLHLYLYGGEFTLYTDCKPIEMILNNPKSKPPARIERWNLRLQKYNFKVVHTKGSENPSDFLSRHPLTEMFQPTTRTEEYINFLAENAVPKAMTLNEIQKATKDDATLQTLIEIIRNRNWQSVYKPKQPFPDNVNQSDLTRFHKIREELTVTSHTEGNIILRGTRIVIPELLRERAVNLAHEGHLGLVKTKKLIREKIWFPGIDELTKRIVDSCIPCQANGPESHPEPVQMTVLPPEPWHTVNVDFCGPFPTGEYLLVVIDAYSRFPEVEIVTSTSAKTTIPKLERIFATHGIPKILKSDNGPPFSSAEIRSFMDENGPVHKRITPLWPQANGQAESFMKPLTKAIRAALISKRSWRKELNKFLLNYRATPHSTTGYSPAELLFNRKINTKLPQLTTESKSKTHRALKKRDAEEKEKMKKNRDKASRAKESEIDVGDTVLVKQVKNNKFSTKFDARPYKVTRKKGTMITAERNDHTITRNVSHFKKLPNDMNDETMSDLEDDIDFDDLQEDATPRRYPIRERRQVQRYGQNIHI